MQLIAIIDVTAQPLVSLLLIVLHMIDQLIYFN